MKKLNKTGILSKIQDFIHSLRPDNTKKKATYDLNIWRRYCSSVGETRTLENIPPNELNILPCRFFMDVRKKMAECTSQVHFHRSRSEKYSALVYLYLKFASHRPEEMKRPEAPLFLAINHKRKPADPVWYSRAPLRKNNIGEFLTKAAKNAGLPENVTNHSVRKTCISRLMGCRNSCLLCSSAEWT